MSVYPNTGCHAVLALLSEGYPPLEGRSPTRYSPVCHSTDPLRDFRVRLACVRHAASVDSEPGSNSHVKFAASLSSRGSRRDRIARTTCLTRADIWLCVVQSVCHLQSPPLALAGLKLQSSDSATLHADTLSIRK